ncbi:MAG TPA: C4-type zinc ribbon domain-containing protein [Pirellulales bacterium]|nr:C4-type zinc ribbon domain-containing protein [Pirellulales bacterium]
MAVNAVALRELHRIHRQLSDLRERLESGPKQVRSRTAGVAQAEEQLAKIQADLKANRVALDQKQLQLKTAEGKVVDLKVKLNQANTNREYQALKDQIAADEMAGSVLADEILEAMEKLDGMKALVPEAEGRVTKAKEELTKIQQQIRAEEEMLRTDVKRLEKELAEAETALPEDFRALYQRVVNAKGEDAMAVVEGGSCGGCYQQLTSNMVNEINMGRVVLCKSCGRVLYLPEDTRPR